MVDLEAGLEVGNSGLALDTAPDPAYYYLNGAQGSDHSKSSSSSSMSSFSFDGAP